MRKQDKIFTVQNLTEGLREAKSIVLANYRGLNVAQMSQLRLEVKKSGGELTVVKNTLLKRALAGLGLELPETEFQGPTAIIVTLSDELAPLKVVSIFAKKEGLPTFKSGIWEGRILDRQEIERLSLLPGKNELISQLLGLLLFPTTRLVQVISNNPKKLILLLKKKEGGEVIHG